MVKKEKIEFSKYEKARIIGARGLQISMDAPLLTEMSEEELNGINYDPLKIAEKELNDGVLPISVNRPMPIKKGESLEKIKVEETKLSDVKKEEVQQEEEKAITESGEMMKLSDPEDDDESESLTNETSENELA